MRALTVGYTYRPTAPSRGRTARRERVFPWVRLLRVILVLVLAVMPWSWALYNFARWQGVLRAREEALRRHERLLAEWNRLTTEERVRKIVAPRGLFKPTEKEILRLR